jgi:DNA-binding GntR family transcriptional regulator
MPELVKILEQIWLRTAPLLNLLYHAGPDPNPNKHFHFAMIAALRAKDVVAVRKALKDDLMIGGTRLVKLMEEIEAGRAVVNRLTLSRSI